LEARKSELISTIEISKSEREDSVATVLISRLLMKRANAAVLFSRIGMSSSPLIPPSRNRSPRQKWNLHDISQVTPVSTKRNSGPLSSPKKPLSDGTVCSFLSEALEALCIFPALIKFNCAKLSDNIEFAIAHCVSTFNMTPADIRNAFEIPDTLEDLPAD
jgi:hypothetical protein